MTEPDSVEALARRIATGGAAAAAAAGLSGLDVGSDLAGSIRVPAAWCGVYGLKATAGTFPTAGFQPPGLPAAHHRTAISHDERPWPQRTVVIDQHERSSVDLAHWIAAASLPGPSGRDGTSRLPCARVVVSTGPPRDIAPSGPTCGSGCLSSRVRDRCPAGCVQAPACRAGVGGPH